MIQKKGPSSKKTIISIILILVMVGGMLYLVLRTGISGPATIPSGSLSAPVGTPVVRFEKSVFEQKDFLTLIQQSSLPEVPLGAKGRPNPFVPLFESGIKN